MSSNRLPIVVLILFVTLVGLLFSFIDRMEIRDSSKAMTMSVTRGKTSYGELLIYPKTSAQKVRQELVELLSRPSLPIAEGPYLTITSVRKKVTHPKKGTINTSTTTSTLTYYLHVDPQAKLPYQVGFDPDMAKEDPILSAIDFSTLHEAMADNFIFTLSDEYVINKET